MYISTLLHNNINMTDAPMPWKWEMDNPIFESVEKQGPAVII